MTRLLIILLCASCGLEHSKHQYPRPIPLQIQDRQDQLLEVKGRVTDYAKKRTAHLDQSHDQQLFYREAGLVLGQIGMQESRLASAGLGDTVEEVEKRQKVHESFERVVLSQDERVNSLEKLAQRMVNNGHFDAAGIRAKMNEVLQKRQQLKVRIDIIVPKRSTSLTVC